MKPVGFESATSVSQQNSFFVFTGILILACGVLSFLYASNFLPLSITSWCANLNFAGTIMISGTIYTSILIYCYSSDIKELRIIFLIGLLFDSLFTLYGSCHFGRFLLPGLGVWITSIFALSLRCVKNYAEKRTKTCYQSGELSKPQIAKKAEDLVRKAELTVSPLTTISVCLFLPLTFFIAIFFLYITVFDHEITDPLLHTVDSTLGFHPSFLSAQLFLSSNIFIQTIIRIIYASLAFAWGIAYILRIKKTQVFPTALMTELLTAGIIGMLLYNIIPAYGPKNFFGTYWPWHPNQALLLPLKSIYIGVDPRNCMPSLHTVWALCIWRQMQNCGRKVKFFSTLWLLLLLFSTMALGEHYLIDVVVGIAFATFIRGLCASDIALSTPSRLYAIAVGAALCFMWYILILYKLSFLEFSIYISWSLFLSTIFLARWFEWRLSRAQNLY
jgi:hypothetical protein